MARVGRVRVSESESEGESEGESESETVRECIERGRDRGGFVCKYASARALELVSMVFNHRLPLSLLPSYAGTEL